MRSTFVGLQCVPKCCPAPGSVVEAYRLVPWLLVVACPSCLLVVRALRILPALLGSHQASEVVALADLTSLVIIPSEPLFKPVQPTIPRQPLFKLESSHDDSGSYVLFVGEFANIHCAVGTCGNEPSPVRLGNKEVRCPIVRFRLKILCLVIGLVSRTRSSCHAKRYGLPHGKN